MKKSLVAKLPKGKVLSFGNLSLSEFSARLTAAFFTAAETKGAVRLMVEMHDKKLKKDIQIYGYFNAMPPEKPKKKAKKK